MQTQEIDKAKLLACDESPLPLAVDANGRELVAYRLPPWPPMPLVPAPRGQAWMDETRERFAYRCLPMLMANQAGWLLISAHAFTATWDGGIQPGSVRVQYHAGQLPYPAVSNFGHGILTILIPYLFRTPSGWNLLARGPANAPKAGAAALEGLVETDWSVAPFSMNWQRTDPDRPVRWEAGEPLCMVVPQWRGALEAFQPKVRDLDTAADLHDAYARWRTSRHDFRAELRMPGSDARLQGWQRHYFQGTAPDGTHAPARVHQTKLCLGEFDDPGGWCPLEETSFGVE